MRFLYVFGLMFLSIFGLVMLVRELVIALKIGGTRQFDVYVKANDNLEEFLRYAEKSPSIGTVKVIAEDYDLREIKLVSDKNTEIKIADKAGDINNESG